MELSKTTTTKYFMEWPLGGFVSEVVVNPGSGSGFWNNSCQTARLTDLKNPATRWTCESLRCMFLWSCLKGTCNSFCNSDWWYHRWNLTKGGWTNSHVRRRDFTAGTKGKAGPENGDSVVVFYEENEVLTISATALLSSWMDISRNKIKIRKSFLFRRSVNILYSTLTKIIVLQCRKARLAGTCSSP